MKAYIYCAALLCPCCAEKIISAINLDPFFPTVKAENSDHYPQGPYANGGGEADTPQHCDHCGVFLENPLTPDGDAYVKTLAKAFDGPDLSWSEIASRADDGGKPALAEWIRFYYAPGM